MTSLDSDPTELTADELREAVRDRYAAAARQATKVLDDGTSPRPRVAARRRPAAAAQPPRPRERR